MSVKHKVSKEVAKSLGASEQTALTVGNYSDYHVNLFGDAKSVASSLFLTRNILNSSSISPGVFEFESPNLNTRFISTEKGIVDLQPTLDRISIGGKYPQRHEGGIYRNRSDALSISSYGEYNEYVVPTPGKEGAGLMRIVTGGDNKAWFTPDHYETFIPIR